MYWCEIGQGPFSDSAALLRLDDSRVVGILILLFLLSRFASALLVASLVLSTSSV